MRSFDETDDGDKEEAGRLGAKPWMLAMLKANPGYVFWGPHEDYMRKEGDGWNSRVIVESWPKFEFQLNELNECVNFYFHVGRASEKCTTCGGNGYHPDAHWVTESFYSHSSPFKHRSPGEERAKAIMDGFGGGGRESPLGFDSFPSEETLAKYKPEFRAFCESMRVHGQWNDRITQGEVDELLQEGRLGTYRDGKWHADPRLASEVNASQHRGGLDGHDGINRSILCGARCERFGIPTTCTVCEGHGDVFTAPDAHLSLTLWWLHPRKGCSRGIEITRVEESEIPAACTFLREAAKRNSERFSKLPG